MRRTGTLAAATIGVVCASAVTAWAGFGLSSYENEFEGRAERDGSTYVGFNVKGSGDDRQVVKVKTHLPYHCDNGEAGRVGAVAKGKLRVKPNGSFRGPMEAKLPGTTRGTVTRWSWTFRGKLVSQRKARGTVDGNLRISGGMGGPSDCYTGVLRWSTKKGADLEPDLVNSRALR